MTRLITYGLLGGFIGSFAGLFLIGQFTLSFMQAIILAITFGVLFGIGIATWLNMYRPNGDKFATDEQILAVSVALNIPLSGFLPYSIRNKVIEWMASKLRGWQ